MRPWLKTRRAWLLVVAAVLCMASGAVLTDGYLPTPVAVGLEGKVLWSTFLPLVWVAAIIDVWSSAAQGVERRPSLKLRCCDAAMFLGASVVGAAIFAAIARQDQTPWHSAGHVLVLTGAASLTTLYRGAGVGALAATALVVLTTLYGARAPLGPYVRLLQPDGQPAWTLGVGLVLCAATVTSLVRGSQPQEPSDTHDI